jgi:AcrR family transcriptional regulator
MYMAYTTRVPKLWNETIEEHRRAVRDATLDTTAALVGQHGLRSVTMSQIAQETGIGRATLYKYYPDVESILVAWHERLIAAHLREFAEIRDRADVPARDRLEAVLQAFALTQHEHRGTELATLLHHGEHFARAQRHLHDFVRDLVAEGAAAGQIRDDVSPDELATYCLHALSAAVSLPSMSAVRRLVSVTLAGLRPAS